MFMSNPPTAPPCWKYRKQHKTWVRSCAGIHVTQTSRLWNEAATKDFTPHKIWSRSGDVQLAFAIDWSSDKTSRDSRCVCKGPSMWPEKACWIFSPNFMNPNPRLHFRARFTRCPKCLSRISLHFRGLQCTEWPTMDVGYWQCTTL